VITAKLVGMILEEQRPDMAAALRAIAPQGRKVALFSLKYMLALGALGAVMVLSTSSQSIRVRLSDPAFLKTFSYAVVIAWTGCATWLLMPSAIRLLQAPEVSPAAAGARRLGTIFTVLTSTAAFALEYVVGKGEAGVEFGNQAEVTAVSVMNTIVENAPEVLLFIVLALLARQAIIHAETQAVMEDIAILPEPPTESIVSFGTVLFAGPA